VERKQEVPKPDLILVATRVPLEVQEAFQRLAEGERRSMSGELRRMIEERLAAADEPDREAAA
jgi:hypothetical protein